MKRKNVVVVVVILVSHFHEIIERHKLEMEEDSLINLVKFNPIKLIHFLSVIIFRYSNIRTHL